MFHNNLIIFHTYNINECISYTLNCPRTKKREKKQQVENIKKVILKNASGPDDVNYAMASGLSKADEYG